MPKFVLLAVGVLLGMAAAFFWQYLAKFKFVPDPPIYGTRYFSRGYQPSSDSVIFFPILHYWPKHPVRIAILYEPTIPYDLVSRELSIVTPDANGDVNLQAELQDYSAPIEGKTVFPKLCGSAPAEAKEVMFVALDLTDHHVAVQHETPNLWYNYQPCH